MKWTPELKALHRAARTMDSLERRYRADGVWFLADQCRADAAALREVFAQARARQRPWWRRAIQTFCVSANPYIPVVSQKPLEGHADPSRTGFSASGVSAKRTISMRGVSAALQKLGDHLERTYVAAAEAARRASLNGSKP